MKRFAAVLVLAALAGCKSSEPRGNSSVTDLRNSTPPAPPAMQPIQPVQPVQPVVADTNPVLVTPAVATTSTPAPAPSAITGSTYTVQKGDTLFKIARAKYGDASAVNKIKAANPGLNADQIKAGQKINLP